MAQLSVGQVVGGHKIENVAGRGGMGVVYVATHLALNRRVALKLISPDLAENDEFRERFKRESELAASLDHPNVIPIYHAGEDDGLLYVTMRYVEGTDLREMITMNGPLDPKLAARIISQIASALDAAHGRGLVHRDVKPANVLLSKDARHAYLTDFGLTKQVAGGGGLTKTGMMVGTLDYIAPEQLQGTAVDARADVYALGCVLYEALTGQVPFPRDTEPAKMWAHMGEEPPSPLQLAPHLPGPFEDLVKRSMAKEPEARFPSAGDLGRAALAAADDQIAPAAERSVATGEAAPGTAASPVPGGATRIDTPAPAFPPTTPGAAPPGTPPAGTAVPGAGGYTTPAMSPPTSSPAAPPGTPPGAYPPPATPPGGHGVPPPGPPKQRRGIPKWVPFAIGGGLLALILLILVVAVVAGGGDDDGGGGADPGPPLAAWVITDEKDVTRLDPRTGQVQATIEFVGQKLVSITTGAGAVWVADETGEQVLRIDPGSNQVNARIAVGESPNAVTFAEGAVFVAAGPSLIAKIDPASNQVTERSEDNGAYDLTAGEGFAWGANFLDNAVMRITPQPLGVTPITQGVGKEPKFVAAGEGAVWSIGSEGNLAKIVQEPGNAQALPQITQAKAQTGEFPGGMAVGEGAVWLAESNTLWRHSPEDGRLEQTIDLGSSFVTNAIAVGGGFVWATDFADGNVVRVNTETNTVEPAVDIQGDTTKIALGPFQEGE